jgi:hypothetical protein
MGGSVYTGLPIVETEEDMQIVSDIIFRVYNILEKIRPV